MISAVRLMEARCWKPWRLKAVPSGGHGIGSISRFPCGQHHMTAWPGKVGPVGLPPPGTLCVSPLPVSCVHLFSRSLHSSAAAPQLHLLPEGTRCLLVQEAGTTHTLQENRL